MNQSVNERRFIEAWRLLDTERDREGAALMAIAAELGYPPAQVAFGFLRETGRGVRRSQSSAIKWYRFAARAYDSAAAYNLGIVALRDRRFEVARRWFERALSLGNDEALFPLAKLYLGHFRRRDVATFMLSRLLASDLVSQAVRADAIKLRRRLQRERRRSR